MQYYLKVTEEMGRGLYSAYDLQANKILFTAELLVLNEKDTKLVNQTDLKWYVFKYNDDQDCLVLGDGEIFNHDDNPNIGYQLVNHDGRKLMMFYTLKDIKSGDQLMIDYESDTKVVASDYKVNLIG